MNDSNSATRAELVRDMVWIEGGAFRMGSDPTTRKRDRRMRVAVDGFWMINTCPVTNREFAAFVAATGYKTVAERRRIPPITPVPCRIC